MLAMPLNQDGLADTPLTVLAAKLEVHQTVQLAYAILLGQNCIDMPNKFRGGGTAITISNFICQIHLDGVAQTCRTSLCCDWHATQHGRCLVYAVLSR